MIAIKSQRIDGIGVLIVDDNADTLELLILMLNNAGATVRDSHNADEAHKILQKWKPDIIVSDLHMPDQDGHTFMKQVRGGLKEEGGQIPAIAITGYGPEDRLTALRSGYQGYIRKPIDAEELIVTIASLTLLIQDGS